MALKLKLNGALVGYRADFLKYERDIRSGKITCPYKVTHCNADGRVVSHSLLPTKANGSSKIDLFGFDPEPKETEMA